MFDFDLLEKEVEKIGSIINAPMSLLIVRTFPIGDGTPRDSNL